MGPKILLVEDEPQLLAALRVRLTASGFTCETAGNGREALAVLSRWRPDMVIADLLMPEMDGYALCRHIRANPDWEQMPVLVLSAVPRRTIGREQELKADCIMHKPFDSGELLTTIKHLLGNASKGG